MFRVLKCGMWVIQGDDRYYPANLPDLLDLIRTEVEWVAIGNESKAEVLALLEQAQVEPRIVAESDRFVVMQVE